MDELSTEAFRADTVEEREAIFRFRYEVYVEELGRYRDVADHAGRRLVEPEDAGSTLYGLRRGGSVVGTWRMTFGATGFSDRQIAQYSLAPFLAELPAECLAVAERLMIGPALRGSGVLEELLSMGDDDLEAQGVRMVFGDCEPHLLPLYLAMGSRPYADRNISSDEAGYLIPLVSFVGAPDDLLGVGGRTTPDGTLALPACVQQVLDRTGAISSPALIEPTRYWDEVRAAIQDLEDTDLHAFTGFEDDEVERCLSHSTVITCAAGDRVVKRGGSSHNLFVVLAGALEVRGADTAVNVLGPGDVFGEMAFLLRTPRQLDVYARSETVAVLSLSEGTLRSMIDDSPREAAKLLLNISKMLCRRLIKADVELTAQPAH